jgi:nicotinamide-nucleotide amidase
MAEEIEIQIVRLLTERGETVSLAESCTGGYIAHLLTNVPGASEVFCAGFVTYSNEAKRKFLGVSPDTLSRHGAVSEPVAREMAEGVRRVSGTDYGLAVTGIAGPGGGSEEKPVGTAFIAAAGSRETMVQHQFNPGERVAFKEATARQALEQLRTLIMTTSQV